VDVEVEVELRTLLRRLAALLLVAVACPVTFFGGALVGCAAQGLTRSCAGDGVLFLAPVLLVGAGLATSLLARGWAGLGFVMLGVLAGMTVIPVVASLAGNPVPIDPVQGVFAAIFFMPPVLLGHGVGRGVARLRARPRGTGGSDRS
jgi:hypothetical protein